MQLSPTSRQVDVRFGSRSEYGFTLRIRPSGSLPSSSMRSMWVKQSAWDSYPRVDKLSFRKKRCLFKMSWYVFPVCLFGNSYSSSLLSAGRLSNLRPRSSVCRSKSTPGPNAFGNTSYIQRKLFGQSYTTTKLLCDCKWLKHWRWWSYAFESFATTMLRNPFIIKAWSLSWSTLSQKVSPHLHYLCCNLCQVLDC